MSERRYDVNSWSKGIPEDKTRCVEAVWDYTGWHNYQCQRKRGYGQNGEYCKQHAKRHPASSELEKKVEKYD